MLRCVKRKSSKGQEKDDFRIGRSHTLPSRRPHSESTEDVSNNSKASNRPSRWSLAKKSATLSGPPTHTQSDSRSGSKTKSGNIFHLSNWRTLSLGSLFNSSKKKKRDESEAATSSGFVSPSYDTEPLVGTSESGRSTSRRPETLALSDMSQSQITTHDTDASTPTGALGDSRKQLSFNFHDGKLDMMTKQALETRESLLDHTPTETAPDSAHFSGATMKLSATSNGPDEMDAITNIPLNKQATKPHEVHKNAKMVVGTVDGNQSLLRATRAGNMSKVVELLNSRADVNATNANGLTALHLAAKEGHLEIARELVRRGADVHAVTKKGNTALHVASLAGHIELVRLLIANDANVNCQSQNGFTPLYMAAQENHVEVVNTLLNHSANPALATEDGFTPLAVALQQGHERVVAVLLERDSRGKTRLPALHIAAKKDDVHSAALLLNNTELNVDHASASGFTPLHIASHYGNVNIAKLLISRGANVNYRAKNSITPLHVAAKWGRDEVVQELLRAGAEIDARTRDGLSPLHCAARSGHVAVVDTLLKAGANVHLVTKNELSPLHMAAQGDHEPVAQLLLNAGGNADAVTVDYLTPLHVAAHCGHVNVARVLLEARCNVNARALNGFTALHIASKKGRTEAVDLLLKNGAFAEAATETGLTPLHVASFIGATEAVSSLLRHGANVDQTTLRNETPLHLAARSGQTETAKVLISHGAHIDPQTRDSHTPLHLAVRARHQTMVQVLLEAGANPKLATRDAFTALHFATRDNAMELVNTLLRYGATSDQTTKKGFTPLHLASKHGNTDIARILLTKANADPNAPGRSGFTPVHVAAFYNQLPLLEILLQHGGDVNKSVKNGFTPLHLAAKRNHTECVQLLAQHGAAVEAESRTGYTPLHLAAQEGHLEVVRLLINRYKASPGVAAKDGLTPLHLAVQEDRVAVAECLLDAGAPLQARTINAGFTPIHTASYSGQLAALRVLLSRIPEEEILPLVNACTQLGSTPLHLAAQQGHLRVVLKLLQSGANPNARNRQGCTPAQLAHKQHYLNVFETLQKVTTDVTDWSAPSLAGPTVNGPMDEGTGIITAGITTFEKAEHMTDHVVSDSEEEGEELLPTPLSARRPRRLELSSTEDQADQWCRTSSYDLICQQLEYMHTYVADDMARSGIQDGPCDDQSKLDASDREQQRIVPEQAGVVQAKSKASPVGLSEWDMEVDSLQLLRKPIKAGFLISFLVDARGCLVRAQRRADLRFFIPPNASPAPTRVICRVLRPEFVSNHPPMNDGDCLAARIIELSPFQMQFCSPILIEVPHIASLRGREREIVVLRSETGTTWKEHTLEANDTAVQNALGDAFEPMEPQSAQKERLIHRILTYDFPQYFAVLSRFRQDIALIGSDGGTITSTVAQQVQAVFPPGALQKRIKVGLQVQPIPQELTTRLAGEYVSASYVVSIEPRRRKFHKPITLTMPLPKPPSKPQTGTDGSTSNVRLLCSLSGGTNPPVWEDITGSTPMTRNKNCVSFTTTVSARFWLLDCPTPTSAVESATRVYRESIVPPLIGRFVVFARQSMNLESASHLTNGEVSEEPLIPRRPGAELTQFRCLCLTDDTEEKTLECLERFSLVAAGTPTEVLENRPYWIELSGNLTAVTKADTQPRLVVRPFQENRVTFPVRLREPKPDESDTVHGRIAFMRDPRHLRQAADELQLEQRPVCVLDLRLPRPGETAVMTTADSEVLGRSELDLKALANQLGSDWEKLAKALCFTDNEIQQISRESSAYSATHPTTEEQKGELMLSMWQQRVSESTGPKQAALGNQLATALHSIKRADVIHPSMTDIRSVVTEDELAAATVALSKKPSPPRVEVTPGVQSSLTIPSAVDVSQPSVGEVEHERETEPTPGIAEVDVASTQEDVSDISTSVSAAVSAPTTASSLTEAVAEPLSSTSVPSEVGEELSTRIATLAPQDWKQALLDYLANSGAQPIPLVLPAVTQPDISDDRIEAITQVARLDVSVSQKVPVPHADQMERLVIANELSHVMEEEPLGLPSESVEDEVSIQEESIEPVIVDRRGPFIPAEIESTQILPAMSLADTETGVPQIIQERLEESGEGVVKTDDTLIIATPADLVLSKPPPEETIQQIPPSVLQRQVSLSESLTLSTVSDQLEDSLVERIEPQVHLGTVGQLESVTPAVKESPLTFAKEISEEYREEGPSTPVLVPQASVHEESVEPSMVDQHPVASTVHQEQVILEPTSGIDEHVEHERLDEAETVPTGITPFYTAPEETQVTPLFYPWPITPSEEPKEHRHATVATGASDEGLVEYELEATLQVHPALEVATDDTSLFPITTAGHDVIQTSPEETCSFEEVEELLPDGSILRSKVATTETAIAISSRDWQEGVDAALDSGAYEVQEPEERTEVEEIEEVLPDGTVITRQVTTRYITDRVVEHAASDEVISERSQEEERQLQTAEEDHQERLLKGAEPDLGPTL